MSLAEEIRACQVREGELALFWLGQAGFLLVDSLGQQLAIDPYLTNCGERIRGFKRISPMMLSPEAFHPEYYITTHTHFDHFDYDAIPVIARNGKTIFLGPESCQQEMDMLYAELGEIDEQKHKDGKTSTTAVLPAEFQSGRACIRKADQVNHHTVSAFG